MKKLLDEMIGYDDWMKWLDFIWLDEIINWIVMVKQNKKFNIQTNFWDKSTNHAKITKWLDEMNGWNDWVKWLDEITE